MRKLLGFVLLIVALFAVSPAHADEVTTYTIDFLTVYTGPPTAKQSGNLAPLPTSGSFTYDSTTQTFSNFIVDWDGAMFDLTAGANSPSTAAGTLPPDVTPGTGGEETFSLLLSDPDALWAVNGTATNSFFTFFDDNETCTVPLSGDGTGCTSSVTTYGLFAGLGKALADPAFAYPGTIPSSSQIASGTFSVVPTPEPSTSFLLGLGLVALIALARMSRRRENAGVVLA